MSNIEICTKWKGLDLIVTVEDYDFYPPDEFFPCSGYVEIDYCFREAYPHPADEVIRMIQAQIDDEPERFFNRIVDERADDIYEKGYMAAYNRRLDPHYEDYRY